MNQKKISNGKNELVIFLDLKPPLISFNKMVTENILLSYLRKNNIQKTDSVALFILHAFNMAKVYDEKDKLYVSVSDVEAKLKKSRSWRIKTCDKLEKIGIFSKSYYLRNGKGALATIYTSSLKEVCFEQGSLNDKTAIVVKEENDNQPIKANLFFNITQNYITKRPSTFFELISQLMTALPSTKIPLSEYKSNICFQNIYMPCKVRARVGESVANDTDIRVLIILCTYVENIIVDSMQSNEALSFMEPFDIKIADIVKIYAGLNKSGKGYNVSIIDAMKRLSWSTIEPDFHNDPKFMSLWQHMLTNSLRHEPSITPLTIATPYFRKNERVQRMKFMLHPVLLKIIKEGAETRIRGDEFGLTTLISNKVVRQADNELMRLDILLYGQVTKYAISGEITWKDLAKLRNKKCGVNSYVSLIRKKIIEKGIHHKNGAYEIDGLMIQIKPTKLLFAKIIDFEVALDPICSSSINIGE